MKLAELDRRKHNKILITSFHPISCMLFRTHKKDSQNARVLSPNDEPLTHLLHRESHMLFSASVDADTCPQKLSMCFTFLSFLFRTKHLSVHVQFGQYKYSNGVQNVEIHPDVRIAFIHREYPHNHVHRKGSQSEHISQECSIVGRHPTSGSERSSHIAIVAFVIRLLKQTATMLGDQREHELHSDVLKSEAVLSEERVETERGHGYDTRGKIWVHRK